jgi:hypothetical protein
MMQTPEQFAGGTLPGNGSNGGVRVSRCPVQRHASIDANCSIARVLEGRNVSEVVLGVFGFCALYTSNCARPKSMRRVELK